MQYQDQLNNTAPSPKESISPINNNIKILLKMLIQNMVVQELQHHPQSGLGEPSVLPLVNCETYSNEIGKQTSVALVSTKQPVPRCPAQQALTILIELQMTDKSSNNSKLKSCAWTKIPLFDSNNRLLSGRWKIEFKSLPIKSDASLSNMTSFPEVIIN